MLAINTVGELIKLSREAKKVVSASKYESKIISAAHNLMVYGSK
jgi:hypothetical protein